MIEAEIERDAVIAGDASLLIVDDDRPFSTRLARAMETRGYRVRVAESVAEGIAAVEEAPPALRYDEGRDEKPASRSDDRSRGSAR